MIARKFHSFSVSIIYVNSKTFWESLQVLYLHIVWGLGLGEGLLKWLYYILTWFGRGGILYTGSSCTLYTYMVWGLELSVGRPLECWWLKTKFKIFHNCCSFLNFKNPFNYINRYIYHKFQLISLKLTVYCAKFCDRVSF